MRTQACACALRVLLMCKRQHLREKGEVAAAARRVDHDRRLRAPKGHLREYALRRACGEVDIAYVVAQRIVLRHVHLARGDFNPDDARGVRRR